MPLGACWCYWVHDVVFTLSGIGPCLELHFVILAGDPELKHAPLLKSKDFGFYCRDVWCFGCSILFFLAALDLGFMPLIFSWLRWLRTWSYPRFHTLGLQHIRCDKTRWNMKTKKKTFVQPRCQILLVYIGPCQGASKAKMCPVQWTPQRIELDRERRENYIFNTQMGCFPIFFQQTMSMKQFVWLGFIEETLFEDSAEGLEVFMFIPRSLLCYTKLVVASVGMSTSRNMLSCPVIIRSTQKWWSNPLEISPCTNPKSFHTGTLT